MLDVSNLGSLTIMLGKEDIYVLVTSIDFSSQKIVNSKLFMQVLDIDQSKSGCFSF